MTPSTQSEQQLGMMKLSLTSYLCLDPSSTTTSALNQNQRSASSSDSKKESPYMMKRGLAHPSTTASSSAHTTPACLLTHPAKTEQKNECSDDFQNASRVMLSYVLINNPLLKLTDCAPFAQTRRFRLCLRARSGKTAKVIHTFPSSSVVCQEISAFSPARPRFDRQTCT